jgi:hypothetical protein
VPNVLFLGLLFGAEGIVRLTLPPIEAPDFFVTASEQRAQFVDRRRIRIYEGDPLLLWRLRPQPP